VVVGGGPVRPIGVSPAPGKLPGESWWRGNQWPPSDLTAAWTNAKLAEYPPGAWSPVHYGKALLPEFLLAQIGSPPLQWNTIDLAPYLPPDPAAELQELLELVEYRSGVMNEAMVQKDNAVPYWSGLLSFNQASHPNTCFLAYLALQVGEFQSMHYKLKFKRPRPSHLSPALMPPIDPPGHPAYPSGHATESYLLSLCLTDVMPTAAHEPLRRVAERVSRNREVLGLHYRSDTVAGEKLAQESFKLMKASSLIQGLMTAAKQEWALFT
jgi:membrane-associated phospholipid phosphatase